MKTKLLAIVLALVCLVQPAMAIGMVGVESAEEIVTIPANEEAKTAEVMAEQPSNVLFYEDFENRELKRIYSLTPEYRKEGVTATVATTWNGVADANWNVIDENGDKVLHINQANGTANNVGFDIQNLNIAEPGVYTLSYQFKEVLGDNATGVDALWGGSGSSGWFQYALYDRSAAAAVAFSPQIPAIPTKFATENLGKWYDVEYQYIIKDTGNGTRSFLTKNSLNSWVGTASTIPANHQLYRVRHYHFFQPNNAATVGNLYIDNFKLTYGQFVTLKFVDEGGNVLTTVDTYQGESITLPTKDSLGLAYTPVFKFGDVNYDGGATATVPVDAGAEYTVTVTEKTFPETVPSNAILYEDYENRTIGAASESAFNYSVKEFEATKITTGAAGYASDRTDVYAYAPDNAANKTFKVENAKSAYAPGFQITNLNLANSGKYKIQYKLYTDAAADKHTTIYYYARINGKDLIRWVYPTIGAAQRNSWIDVSYNLEVYEDGGVRKLKYDTDKVMDCPENFSIQFYAEAPATSASNTINVWYDDVLVTYTGAVTVKYVDESGKVLNSVDTYQGANITLPDKASLGVAYTPLFKIGDATYESGAVVTIPANAEGEYTITVSEKTFPVTAPENAIVFEDYENRTIGAASAAKVSYTTEELDGLNIFVINEGKNDGKSEMTYAAAPDNANNKTFKVVSKSQYAAGLYIYDFKNFEPGKYVVSYKWYTDGSVNDFPALNVFGRLHAGSQLVPLSGFPTYNTENTRNTWNEMEYSFEIYEENGVKYVKNYANNTFELTETFFLKFFIEKAQNVDAPLNVWFDDVAVTFVDAKPVIFMDEEGLPFEYQGQTFVGSNTYTLPENTDMGISFDVEFVGEDGKTYLPGTSYTLDTSKEEYTFFVKKSNTVFYESFDKKSAGGDQKTEFTKAPLANSYTNPGAVSAADANGNKTAVWTNGGTYNEQNFWCYTGLKFNTAGIYKFSINANLVITGTKTDADTSMKINMKEAHQYGPLCNDLTITEGIPATLEGNIEVFEKSDGTLGYNTLNTTGNASSLSSVMIGVKFNSIKDSTATYTVYFDNAKIEYIPYNPVNTMKASYRGEDEDGKGGPAGIRFAAYVNEDQRKAADEYGFVVTRKSLLGGDNSKLNLKGIENVSANYTTSGTNSDGVIVVATAAYKENGVDRIYVQNGEIFGLQGLYEVFYTAVLYGMNTDVKKSEIYVVRPYAKVDGVYYYGECHEDSYDSVKARAEAGN